MYTDTKKFRSELDRVEIGYVWEANKLEAPPKMLKHNATLRMFAVQKKLRNLTPQLTAQYNKEIVAEYCWMAYQKSNSSKGDMVIGRQEDLARQGLYEKVAELVCSEYGPMTREDTAAEARAFTKGARQSEHEEFTGKVVVHPMTKREAEADKKAFGKGRPNLTFLDEGVHGNLLNQDKWAGPVNDAWVLGGIHRLAQFRLTSPRIMKNLWNAEGYLIVTAREILGLLCFGYELREVGKRPGKPGLWWVFVPPKNETRALKATLSEYGAYVLKHETIAVATALMEMRPTSGRPSEEDLMWALLYRSV